MPYRYKRRDGWAGVVVLVISILFTITQQQGWLSEPAKTINQAQPGSYSVTRFVDGDTIEINMNGHKERVRFVGVDTPETHKPNTPVQCYGPAAAAYTKNTIGNQPVRLVSDSLSTDRDRYDRLLRYVYLPDGRMMNQLLIQSGYGFYYPYFPFSKSTQFAADQTTAQAAHKGLWGNCNPTKNDRGGYTSNSQS